MKRRADEWRKKLLEMARLGRKGGSMAYQFDYVYQ